MNNNNKFSKLICPVLMIAASLLLNNSCKKDEPGIQIKDRDGNTYTAITIGTQTWLRENLKTTSLNDGTPIPLVSDDDQWELLSTPGYCWYNDDLNNKNTYGALYNWFTVNSGKLCPTGYHVPSLTEWSAMVTFLGGDLLASAKLKETGMVHWETPNLADNSSGFTALPAGVRFYSSGTYSHIGFWAFFWTSTESNPLTGWAQGMYNDTEQVYLGNARKEMGYSCRCIQD